MDLSQIRQQLSERKTLLEARAEKTERDASHRDAPLPADFAEQATERENDDVLRAIAGESVHEIELINQALARIEAGTYGECSECGDNISEQRLAAVPYTTLCVKCAESHE
ncbi:MAG: conjugal transfer protein TraR [Oceanospirillaceae bacterium]|nr:conjugal transfer protein TraR [Oceanospirillaceae bacterium]MBT12325.1 conjugal transfer protein TraR [Oceanospirillaceae bacterium]|tara:strand:- start:29724 stop:30056 length:333 start_codon:yes stop_codon:yes gene_type:complete